MKILYGILCHKNLEQVVELIETFAEEDYVIVHIDKNTSFQYYRKLKKICEKKRNIFILEDRVKIYWGHENMVKATIKMINFAIKIKKLKFDYMTLLTGQDCLVKTNTYIKEYLEDNKYEFLNLWGKLPIPIWEKNEERVFTYVFTKFFFRTYDKIELKKLKNLKFVLKKIMNKFFYNVLSFRIKKEYAINWFKKNSYDLYCGSQMWTLSYQCLNYILDFIEKNPQYLKIFNFSFGSDEIFFHTIIMNSDFKKNVLNHLHYIEYGNIKNLVTMKAKEQWSKKNILYARKFDINEIECQKVLEYIKKNKGKIIYEKR